MGLGLVKSKVFLLSSLALITLLATACGGSTGGAGSTETDSEEAAEADDVSSGDAAPIIEPSPTRSVLLPEIYGISNWINSEPTTIEAELERGNVVLIDFWTYTCINCLRTMPHLKGWYEKYADRGLTIIGVHSPEFDFENEILAIASGPPSTCSVLKMNSCTRISVRAITRRRRR